MLNKSVIFVIILSSFFNFTFSQIKKEKLPLVLILNQLEEQYDIKFSYESKSIDNILIYPLSQNISLEEALQILKKSTLLNFNTLSKRFIAIKPYEDLKSPITTHQLDEVIISNYLTKGLAKSTDGSTKINSKAFQILPGLIEPDVLQIFQNLPGIISVDERISNLNVRGGTNDQNLIIYEGIRMYQSGHFFGLISAFNPYLSEDIKISKNGTSAKYGDGISSTITIKNDNVVDGEIKSGIGANLLSLDGYSKIPLTDKAKLLISGRRSFTDIIASTTYDSYFDHIFRDSQLNASNDKNTQLALDERFLFYDFNAKYLYDISKSSKLRVNILNIYNKLNYNQIFTTSDNRFQESRSTLQQVSYGASAKYSILLNERINSSVEFYYSNYNLDAENDDKSNEQRLIQENKVRDIGLRLEITNRINESVNMNSGYQFNEVGVTNFEDVTNPDFTSLVKEIIRTHVIFTELEWVSKSQKSFAKLGARASFFEKLSRLRIEPRLSVNHKFLNYYMLEILGELKSQSITQIVDLQQDFFGIEKYRWQLANNQNVPLITSKQTSVGVSFNKNNLLVSAQAYLKNVNDITAQSQGFQNQYKFVNSTGSYNVKGIDVLINKRFTNFSTWLSYTYSKNDYNFKDLNENESFPNTLDLRHMASASLIYNLENLKIAFGVNWHSGRAYTSPEPNQNDNNSFIEYKSPNGSRLPSYFRTDISVIYKFDLFNNIKSEIGASVWNLFNQSNIINRYYTFGSDNTILEINNRSLKFTPNISCRVNF